MQTIEQTYISEDKIIEKSKFWGTLDVTPEPLLFSSRGSFTLDVPEFHLENIRKITLDSKTSDYQYAKITGRDDLRDSFIENFPPIQHFKDAGLKISKNNVLVHAGALTGIRLVIDNLCQPGDEIIMFEPVYPGHLPILRKRKDVHLKTVTFAADPITGHWKFDSTRLQNALSSKTRFLIVINPHNPCGKVFTKVEFQEISRIIEPYPNLVVLEDAAYFLYHSDEKKPIPFAAIEPTLFHRSITFYSGGKTYNVTGLRVGLMVASTTIIQDTLEALQKELIHASTFEQMAIREDLKSALLEYNSSGLNFYEFMRKDINERMLKVTRALQQVNIKVLPFDGTYYLIIDIESWREKIDVKYYNDLFTGEFESRALDKAFFRMMYSKAKVGLVPLSNLYFSSEVDSYLRVTVCRNDTDLELFINAFKSLKDL